MAFPSSALRALLVLRLHMELLRVHLRVTLNGLADCIKTITVSSYRKQEGKRESAMGHFGSNFHSEVPCQTEDSDNLLGLLL